MARTADIDRQLVERSAASVMLSSDGRRSTHRPTTYYCVISVYRLSGMPSGLYTAAECRVFVFRYAIVSAATVSDLHMQLI